MKIFARALKAVSRAMSGTDTLNNLVIDVRKEHITLVATNGHWLAAWRHSCLLTGPTTVALDGPCVRVFLDAFLTWSGPGRHSATLTLGPPPEPMRVQCGLAAVELPCVPLDEAKYLSRYEKIAFPDKAPEATSHFAADARYLISVAEAFRDVLDGHPTLLFQTGGMAEPAIVMAEGCDLRVALMPMRVAGREVL